MGAKPHEPHLGTVSISVGPYSVRATGAQYRGWLEAAGPGTVLVALTNLVDYKPPNRTIQLPLEDFGGVPGNWKHLLERLIIPELQNGTDLLPFCIGSHGRTGTLLASLIALLEDPEETPDPIAAVRERHCIKAVETGAQARGVFALRSQDLPVSYRGSFRF